MVTLEECTEAAIAAEKEPHIDGAALLKNIRAMKINPVCPVCGTGPEGWKVHERYLDFNEAISLLSFMGGQPSKLKLILVTCKCAYAMIFNFTAAVEKANIEHLKKLAEAGKRGSAAGAALKNELSKEKAK